MKRIIACAALTLSIAAFLCGCNMNPAYNPDYNTAPVVTSNVTTSPRSAVTPRAGRARVPAKQPGVTRPAKGTVIERGNTIPAEPVY